MSMVQQAIEVGAPLHTVYEQLAAFEDYPRFMTGVQRVTPVGGDRTHWVMDVEGHRKEFDAKITERSVDERVSWATTDGPLLAETITVRPMGDRRTQVVAQLEADVAFLMPNDKHGQETLNLRLKRDLTALKGLIEGGTASSKQLAGGARINPASVAARIRKRDPLLPPAVDITTAPGISNPHDLDDVLAPGRRIGTAPMGGRTPAKDLWGDGMLNEEDRGSA